MPHFAHAIVLAILEVMDGVLTNDVICFLTMSSRSYFDRRDTCSRAARVVAVAGAGAHALDDIDPDEPANMSVLLAFE